MKLLLLILSATFLGGCVDIVYKTYKVECFNSKGHLVFIEKNYSSNVYFEFVDNKHVSSERKKCVITILD